jgi:PTH1 family peptidyl-tRNA hydrolase
MKIIVGLGNPGSRYAGTRHNVGFEVVDMIAAGPGTGPWRRKFEAQVAEVQDRAETILLVKPETFMNLSGQSVRSAMDFYKLSPSDLLVVCDDMALPLGKLRVRASGTHGGHNGLRDIQSHLGTPAYPRLRVGVGGPTDEAVDHVLGRFKPSEKRAMTEAIALATEAAMVWVREGVNVCMNRYNGEPNTKPKKPKEPKRPTDAS